LGIKIQKLIKITNMFILNLKMGIKLRKKNCLKFLKLRKLINFKRPTGKQAKTTTPIE
jgi:hypothetical protein